MLRENVTGNKWEQGDAVHGQSAVAPSVVANTWQETQKETHGHERENVPGKQTTEAKVPREGPIQGTR